MNNEHLTNTNFNSFNLPSTLLQGIEKSGFSYCTPIQEQAIAVALEGSDIAGQAKTGTGKTAAFLIATMHHLLTIPPREGYNIGQPRALILAPTRELAVQIHKDAAILGYNTTLRLGLAYGGTGYEQQRKTLQEGIDILIGTPGRLIDYFKQHVFALSSIQTLVIDEADRMFDLGFIKDIRFLLRRMPKAEHRLGLLFSATLSLRVMELAYEYMNNPKLIKIDSQNMTVTNITERVYFTANDEKIPLLLGLLKTDIPTRSIVFSNTKRMGEKIGDYLQHNGFKSAVLSGDVHQLKRQRLLAQFHAGEIDVLVATDVAARGLHIPAVSHVFNFDLPQDGEDYIHRVGRTARLGASGTAISFACENHSYHLPEIEEMIGHKIPVAAIAKEDLFISTKPAWKPHAHNSKRTQSPRNQSRRHNSSKPTK